MRELLIFFKWPNSGNVKGKHSHWWSIWFNFLFIRSNTRTWCEKWPHIPNLVFICSVTHRSQQTFKQKKHTGGQTIKNLLCLNDAGWEERQRKQKKGKEKKKKGLSLILQHLVQSAPWSCSPMGGSAPAVKESGGCEPALFFYSIKNACGWSALWITCRATPDKSIHCSMRAHGRSATQFTDWVESVRRSIGDRC